MHGAVAERQAHPALRERLDIGDGGAWRGHGSGAIGAGLALWRPLAGRRPSTASQLWAASIQIFEPALYLVSSAHGAGTAICSIYLSPGPAALRLGNCFVTITFMGLHGRQRHLRFVFEENQWLLMQPESR